MNAQTTNPFAELFAQFGSIDVIKSSSPLLAHYTDIATAEQVITNDTIWLSNPLFMNDISEVRFGIIAGVEIFRANPHVFPAAGSDNRLKIIQTAFETAFAKDRNELSLDSYVFCFSKHDVETDSDGRLSMWRAYGGNGEGAAIVLSTAELANQNGPSPLLLAEVKYKSHEEQRDLLRKIVDQWCAVVKQSNFPDALLDWASYSLFLLIKYFALSY